MASNWLSFLLFRLERMNIWQGPFIKSTTTMTTMKMMSNVLLVRFAVKSVLPIQYEVFSINFFRHSVLLVNFTHQKKKKFSVMRSNFVCNSLIEATQRLIDFNNTTFIYCCYGFSCFTPFVRTKHIDEVAMTFSLYFEIAREEKWQ